MNTYQTIELLMQLNLETDEELEQWMRDYQDDGNLPDIICSTKDKKDIVINPFDLAELLSNWEGMIDKKDIYEWDNMSDEDFFNFDDPPKEATCRHEWAPIRLLNSTVYDCKKCGVSQEKVMKK